MKISTKFILISLVVSFIPIVTVILNEIVSLMRDMNWMVNQIRIRESKLKNMLIKLENSESQSGNGFDF